MYFRDLSAQYHALKNEIDKRIESVIESSCFIFGDEVFELEKKLADYVGVKHCITCASGTDALTLVLDAWGITKGDAVFIPDFTFFATANCAMRLSAAAVICDINEDTFNIDPESLENAIKRTIAEGKYIPRVIIPVDLFGQCADYDNIRRIADKYDLKILEDAAQGFGGSINGKMAGSFGDAAGTSFYPAKPLGCYGDGGAIFCDSDSLDERLRSLRAQGRAPKDKYDNRETGFNSRLDTLQAAVLLPKFDAFCRYELESINKAAQNYTDRLKGYVKTPLVPHGFYSSWAQYTVLLKDDEERNCLREHLKQKDIPTMIYYPRGMHSQTAVIKAGFSDGNFPVTESVVRRCLSLPIHPYIEDEQEKIITAIEEFFK